jgi:tripartite-type tricarboxylate transporter receptor subunit TctC
VSRDLAGALADPQVKDRLLSRGFEVAASTPEAFAAFLKQESEATGRLVKAANITVQ